MNNKLISSAMLTFHKVTAKLQKSSPEILVVVGVAGVVVSTVMACKATTKVQTILDEHKDQMDAVHNCDHEDYTPEDAKKDTAIIYTQTGVKLAKLYAPAVAIGVTSLACLIGSNYILRKRNAALTAAFATVNESFKKYRERVVKRFGQEVDHELKHGIKASKVKEKVTNPETGEETTETKTVNIIETDFEPSEYARFFDELSEYYEKDAEYNLVFLRSRQQYANDILRSRGRLFLNEVYRMLGIPETKAGQIVGWVYDPDHPVGDNYVDFGIYDVHKAGSRNFVNGVERSILLDFNVDGNIWELMS